MKCYIVHRQWASNTVFRTLAEAKKDYAQHSGTMIKGYRYDGRKLKIEIGGRLWESDRNQLKQEADECGTWFEKGENGHFTRCN